MDRLANARKAVVSRGGSLGCMARASLRSKIAQLTKQNISNCYHKNATGAVRLSCSKTQSILTTAAACLLWFAVNRHIQNTCYYGSHSTRSLSQLVWVEHWVTDWLSRFLTFPVWDLPDSWSLRRLVMRKQNDPLIHLNFHRLWLTLSSK